MRLSDSARLSPGRLLLAGAIACALFCWFSTWLALVQPWLGLTLNPDFDSNVVHLTEAEGPSAHLPAPSVLVSARAETSSAQLALAANDLIEEPDFFDTYAEMTAHFARQTAFAEALRGGVVILTLREPEGELREYRVQPSPRPISSLPPVFWFQLFAGTVGCLLALWVLVLRPRDWGARMFALTGVTFPVFTVPAAVYSTRELALDGTLFRTLSSINHAGAFLFGCGLVGLFLSFPRQLVRPRWLFLIFVIFVPWLAADITQIAPNQSLGHRTPILLQMLFAVALGIVQWRMTRNEPHDRAALRWLGLSMLVGSSLFVFGTVGSRLLGWFSPWSQGYSFGFFLLMDVGLALGLRRHRLFELDEWAYRILFWVLGALGLIVLDVLLIVVLRTDPTLSLSVSLIVAGFVYLPIRNWLWSATISGKRVEAHELFQDVLQVSFAASTEDRMRLWRDLLRKVFNPLELHPIPDVDVDEAVIGRDGLRLDLPSVASSPAIRLEYPWGGRSLFGPRHLRLATNLVTLVQHADRSRDAYDRGVREERHRIARDLHDDIGARLLGGLHGKTLEDARQTIRNAISDMGTIVTELAEREASLQDVLADLRYETSVRLEDAGLALDWPLREHDAQLLLDGHVHKHYLSMFRELISNVIRHAKATRVSVLIDTRPGRLVTTISDDGIGIERGSADQGHGLRNLRERTSALGGDVSFCSARGETRVILDLPFRRGSIAPSVL